MNVNLFLTDLAAGLGTGITTPNGQQAVSGLSFSASLLQTSMCVSVRNYNRWRTPLRPYGSGVIYSPVIAGAGSIQLIGGPWVKGQTILIGTFWNQESFTVADVGPGSQLTNWMGSPLTVSLSGNLAYNHGAGEFAQMQSPGMVIAQNINQYQLPSDFSSIDAKTFNYANGTQGGMIHREFFYDNAYVFSQALSGVGQGLSQTFMGASRGAGYGLWAVADSPVGAYYNPPTPTGSGILFQLMQGIPPIFIATPTPQFNATWMFNYRGQHTPETVPDEDFDALLDLAKAYAVAGAQAIYAGLLDWKEDDVNESPSRNADALMNYAKEAQKQFDIKIRLRPYMITG